MSLRVERFSSNTRPHTRLIGLLNIKFTYDQLLHFEQDQKLLKPANHQLLQVIALYDNLSAFGRPNSLQPHLQIKEGISRVGEQLLERRPAYDHADVCGMVDDFVSAHGLFTVKTCNESRALIIPYAAVSKSGTINWKRETDRKQG